MKRITVSFAVLTAFTSALVFAETNTWTGSGSDNTWTNTANWSSYSATDTNWFSGNVTPIIDFNFDTTTAGILLSGSTPTVTITNNLSTMTLTGGYGINVQTGTLNLNVGTVTMGAAQSWTVASAAFLNVGASINNNGNLLTAAVTGAATFSGALTGNSGLTKSGTGTLTLTGNNSYSGGTAMNDGLLYLGGASGAALGSGDLTIGTGVSGLGEGVYLLTDQTSGVIHFHSSGWNYVRPNGHNWTVAGLDNPAGVNNNGVVENGGANQNLSTSGTMTLNVGIGNTYTYAGIIRNADAGGGTGLLNLVKNGSGTQILKGTNPLAYTGSTTINAGTLTFDLSANGGGIGYASAVNIGGTGVLKLNSSTATAADSIYFNSSNFALTGTGTLTKTGTGYIGLIISGTGGLQNFQGTVDVQEGILGNNGTAWAAGTGSNNLNVASVAKFDLRTGDVKINVLSGSGTISKTWSTPSTLRACFESCFHGWRRRSIS